MNNVRILLIAGSARSSSLKKKFLFIRIRQSELTPTECHTHHMKPYQCQSLPYHIKKKFLENSSMYDESGLGTYDRA
jgi:hypothetical protein